MEVGVMAIRLGSSATRALTFPDEPVTSPASHILRACDQTSYRVSANRSRIKVDRNSLTFLRVAARRLISSARDQQGCALGRRSGAGHSGWRNTGGRRLWPVRDPGEPDRCAGEAQGEESDLRLQ